MAESLKNKTIKGVAWSGIERFSVQGIQFLVTLVIANILSPKDFGLIGMLTIFIAIADSLCNSGFSQALIRKQNRSEVDNSTVFYFNIGASAFLYGILYFVAPWVAVFYDEPELCDLMRVLCLIVIIHSFAVVQRAIFMSLLDFKRQAKASFIAAVISGIFGVYLAINGYGVWTLVWQQLINAFLNTLLLWLYSTWRPQLVYSWKSFRDLFTFGSKLLVSGLIDTVYTNMYMLVIGKVFTASSLGHYTQAKRFTDLPSSNITMILQRVTYPVLCTLQNDTEKLKNDYRQLLRLSAFIVFPLMCGLAGIAHPLINLLIGEEWNFAAFIIVPLCFGGMWYPIHAINLNLLQVKGRSDLFLRLEIIKKIIGVTVLVVSIRFGLLFLCYSGIFTSVVCLAINTYYTGKLIGVGFLTQMRDISATLLVALLMFALVYALTLLFSCTFLSVFVGLLAGAIFYLSVATIFKFPELSYIKSFVIK